MQEGADILMVKPGMPYLDVVRRVKQQVPEFCMCGLCMKYATYKYICIHECLAITNYNSSTASKSPISNLPGEDIYYMGE